jgi:hypothetical protein
MQTENDDKEVNWHQLSQWLWCTPFDLRSVLQTSQGLAGTFSRSDAPPSPPFPGEGQKQALAGRTRDGNTRPKIPEALPRCEV